MSLIVVFPLTVPKVKGISHLDSAGLEDGNPTYDMDGIKNGVVRWDPGEDHFVPAFEGYVIEANMTLIIPTDVEVIFGGFTSRKIDVYGTLLTSFGSLMPPSYTKFWGGDEGWEGIFFHNGSKGRIVYTVINKACKGIVFEPGSELLPPGIMYTSFEDVWQYGLRMDGVKGFTELDNVQFDDSAKPSAHVIKIANGNLNMKNVFVYSHGRKKPGLNITNASVSVSQSWFNGNDQPGNMVHIEAGSDGTKLDNLSFMHGGSGDHYIMIDGSSNLIKNCQIRTNNGTLSVTANDNNLGIPSHPTLLNPVGFGAPGSWGDSFDNSTMNATGNSSVTLQWYMDVHVVDPHGNSIDNAPVWVNDRLGYTANPASKITDDGGWARGFIVTELIQYNNSLINFNPFNVSSMNNSVIGYAKPIMNMSREVTVVVPFSMAPNTPPNVSWLPQPSGLQSDFINFDYMLEDPDPGDHGNMSIFVDFSTDGVSWQPVIFGPGSELKRLNNNTLYHFIWDSSQNLGHGYYPTVYIRVTPRDRAGNGTFRQTGGFAVENKAPVVSWLSTPTGVKSGHITFDFVLVDPNPGDNGHLGIFAEYSTDGLSWQPAISGPGSDLNGLKNNTLYHFTWDSTQDLGNGFYPTVYIRIIPRDRVGNGTSRQTGNFTVDNKPPFVSWLQTPVGVQSGPISIDFILFDPKTGNNGSLSIEVYWSLTGIPGDWNPATTHPSSDPTSGLSNNIIYTFVWDSKGPIDIPNVFNTTVYILIIPYDRSGPGFSNQTGNFTVDNVPPVLLTGPVVTPSNTTAFINWTVDEPANASVWWGLWPDLGPKTTGSTGSNSQSVQLTGLQQGRTYIYTIISEDRYGNWAYLSTTLSFETEIHIQLYKGWNMISLPPYILDSSPEDVLASIAGEYETVQAYFVSDQVDPWKHYRPAKPFGNDLLYMESAQGYWILMKNNAVLIPDHKDPIPDPLFDGTLLGLEVGWNFIGYPSIQTRSMDKALAGVPYDMIQTYDAASGQWLSYDGTSGDLTHMGMGHGYWIHCTSAYDWQLKYDE